MVEEWQGVLDRACEASICIDSSRRRRTRSVVGEFTTMSALQSRREAQGGHRQRSVRECVSEIETGATALSELAHGWLIFLPRPTALSGAEASLEGLRRLVAELRQRTMEGG